MDIRVEPAERRLLKDIHVVPGRIQYDDARRVDLRAAASGIVVEVRVLAGDHVSAGQVLAVLSSPEIGLARTEVHHAHESWDLASKKKEWTEETTKNVTDLLEGLKNRVPMNELEKRFRGKTLGQVSGTALGRLCAVSARGESRTERRPDGPRSPAGGRRSRRGWPSGAAQKPPCEGHASRRVSTSDSRRKRLKSKRAMRSGGYTSPSNNGQPS